MKKIFIILICFIVGCANTSTDVSTSNKEEPVYGVLNTIDMGDDVIIPFNATIRIETNSDEELDVLYPLFQEKMTYYSKLFDGYHLYDGINNIMRINHSYGTQEVITIEKDLYDLLQLSIEISELTEGKFNPTIGALYDVWKDKFSPFPIENEDPNQEEIENALACTVSYNDLRNVIELQENNQQYQVIFHPYDGCSSQVKINLGAIAKGYAIDLMNEELSTYEIPYLIDGGNSSISVYIPENVDQKYYMGVRNPEARVMSLFHVQYHQSGAFTSSGDDSQYFLLNQDDGSQIIRHHLLDPTTGYPNNYQRCLCIESDFLSNGIADALSTALFNCATVEEKNALIEKIEEQYNITLEYAYYVINQDESVLYTTSQFMDSIVDTSYSDAITRTEVIDE